jgi:DNA ligase-1
MAFKPMLAPSNDPLNYPNYFKELRYPLLGSPKYDGIRGVVKDAWVKSRTLKPLPSYQVQDLFAGFADLDGEIIEGNPTDYGVYNRTQSFVMSEEKESDNLTFNVFDHTSLTYARRPFMERLERAREAVDHYDSPNLVLIEHELIENETDLLIYEDKILELGFEGIMLRDPFGDYKFGRGTWREGLIYKLKRFQDSEGIVIGIEEAEENTNERTVDERGYAKRSAHQAGKIPKGMVGTFIVDFDGMKIRVAPGVYTHDERKEIWENPYLILGGIMKFRHFAHGIKTAPRHARALGLRNPMDM